MRLIDLSQSLSNGMPVYPGDPAVGIRQALTIAADGVAVARLDLGSHAGTHLDAPAHVIPGGRTVDQIPLELLVGPAAILRVAEPRSKQCVDEAALQDRLPAELPTIVAVQTGWDRHYGKAGMLDHPYVAPELAELLWARGARVLCVDTLSPDPSAGSTAGEGAGLPVHEYWLGRAGVVVENLRGLERVPDRAELSLLPLAISGGDGAPVRAIAWSATA